MVSQQQGLLALYSATAILAINGVLSKAIQLDAVSITFLRCAIAIVALAAIFKVQRGKNLFRLLNPKRLPFVVLVGLLMAAHWSSFFHSMQISTVAIGILAHYSFPVITVILEPLWDKQRPKLADIIAACVVLVGVALMVPSWQAGGSAVVGVAFGLLSATTWGLRNIVQRRYLAAESGQTMMFYQLLVIVLATAVFIDIPSIQQLAPASWWMLLLLGVVSTALGHTLISISLRVLNAKSISLISCLQPPLAVALAWLFLSEAPNLQTFLGGGLILLVALYETQKTKKEDAASE